MASTLADQFQVLGGERLSGRGALIVPSQLTFNELLVLEKHLSARSLAYLIEENAVLDPPLQHYVEKEEVTTHSFNHQTTQPVDLQKELHREINQERLVIYVPGKSATIPNPLTTVPSELLKFLVETRVRVQPLYVERPYEFRAAVEESSTDQGPTFAFGEPLEREAANLPNFQESLMEASEMAFLKRPILKQHLGYVLLQSLKRQGSANGLIDGADGSTTPYDRILAASIALSQRIKKRTSKSRVGIILPPGRAGYVANVAVVLANKVPVNLNFTASKDAVNSSIEQADLDLFITAERFQQKMTRFDWPAQEKLFLLDKVLPKMKWKIAWWLGLTKTFAAPKLASWLKLPQEGGEKEAVLLFTSGSSGNPKGVALTHVNVLSNVYQFNSRLNLSRTDRVLGCLPLFHSFGCTVTMWFPMLEGYTTVTYTSPLETTRLAKLIEEHHVSLLFGTPTFLRGYLRKGTAEQFKNVKLVIAGAEKLPPAVAEGFRDKLATDLYEGYGLTETSPVSNVNLPNPESIDSLPTIPAYRSGSVGLMLPGVAVRITDPDTDVPLPLHESGMIWLRGPNIFHGYLNEPEKSAEVLHGKWFKTGDLGRVDEDGFLYIEGRLTRFSKIGGEMVPHETVETYLNNALRLGSDEERQIAVAGIPDEAKGESLVLLTSVKEIDFDALRKHLIAEGVPSLWVPRKCQYVETIPMLASGKLDIRACQEMALKA